MKAIIRQAKRSDGSAMYDISLGAHAQTYYDNLIPEAHKQMFADQYVFSTHKRQRFISGVNQRLRDSRWHLLVAETEGRVVGYTQAYEDDDKLLLKGLFVDPNFHRQGIGTMLFEASLSFAHTDMPIEFNVIRANSVAKAMYEKYNFTVIGQAKRKFFGAVQDIMQQR